MTTPGTVTISTAAFATGGILCLGLAVSRAMSYWLLHGAYQVKMAVIYTLAAIVIYIVPALRRDWVGYLGTVRVLSFGSAAFLALLAMMGHFSVPARDGYAALAVAISLLPGVLAHFIPKTL